MEFVLSNMELKDRKSIYSDSFAKYPLDKRHQRNSINRLFYRDATHFPTCGQ